MTSCAPIDYQPKQDSTTISEENLIQEQSQKDNKDKSSKSKEIIQPHSKPQEEKTEEKRRYDEATLEILSQQNKASESGNMQKCLAICEALIKLHPSDSFFYNNYGENLLVAGRYEDALEAYNKAIELDPNEIGVLSNKGYALYLISRSYIDKAIAFYDKQLEMDQDDFLSYMKKAKILQERGQTEEANKLFCIAYDIISKGELDGDYFIFYKDTEAEKVMKLNKLELDLVKFVLDNQNDSSTEPINEENKDEDEGEKKDKKEKKNEEMMKFMIAELEKRDQEIANLNKRIDNHDEAIDGIKEDLKDSGTTELAHLSREVKKLEELENKEIYAYYTTFYWSLLNSLHGYRILGTGQFLADFENTEGGGQNTFVRIMKDITAIAKRLPIVKEYIGDIMKLIEDILDVSRQNQINAMNRLIFAKFRDESRINLIVMKIGLAITETRKNKLNSDSLNIDVDDVVERTADSIFDKVQKFLLKFKAETLNFVELHDPKSPGATLALQDSFLLITYICINWKNMKVEIKPLEKQVDEIVKKGELEKILEEKKKKASNTVGTILADKCPSCNIF